MPKLKPGTRTMTMLSTLTAYRDPNAYCPIYEPKSITDQVSRLRTLFPHLGTAEEQRGDQPLPKGAEAWFAIPKWQTIASTYGQATETVLEKIRERCGMKFKNYRNVQLGSCHFRQVPRTARAFAQLGREQKMHDILVIAAQLGARYRGRSVYRTRQAMLPQEFGLDAYAVGMILLTHPDRLTHYYDLHIDCAGNEYSVVGNDHYQFAPVFLVGADHCLWFNAELSDGGGSIGGGSASAFLTE